jgi:hypothetical protein
MADVAVDVAQPPHDAARIVTARAPMHLRGFMERGHYKPRAKSLSPGPMDFLAARLRFRG